jgi:DNA processing protein
MKFNDALMAVQCIDGMGPRTIFQLMAHFSEPQRILEASAEDLSEIALPTEMIQQIVSKAYTVLLEKQRDFIEKQSVKIVSYWDSHYPEPLRHVYAPPAMLFYFGEWSKDDDFALAVVGTRFPDEYGKTVTRNIADEIAAQDITIVSGLARGVDSIAHYAAVQQKKRTIAILGTNLSIIYPAQNRSLANQIVKNGVVASEYLVDTPQVPGNFVRRNRIISGLSRGVVITQAGEKSGALITANYAVEQNREVFAVPGSVYNEKQAGCHRLLRDGAKLTTNIDDIVKEFPFMQKESARQLDWISQAQQAVELSGAEGQIIGALTKEGRHVDDIVIDSGLNHSQVMTALLTLELKGYVKQMPGKYYVRQI